MSQTIDQKVVEMKFENSNFESNVKQSMSTLEKLKKELDLEGASEGFKNISKSAKDVSFDGLKQGIEDVNVHFSKLETIGKRVLENITDSAYKAGANFAKSLSIDNISGGWDQYASKTQSVQTIMNATGKDINAVNASLDKLIWFADETSYSFSDMVDNVGKFTSVGVDLDDASKAMMGIANWSAVSGQNAQTATRAMYNLSQAMGLGYVGLMDWKSIELANMATVEFKDNVISTAKELGKLDAAGKTAKGTSVDVNNLRSTLNEGWFDNEVLLAVLSKYGGYTDLVYDRVKETGELCAEAMNNVAAEMGDSYDAIGEKALRAAQEAKTFAEVIDATKDAVKSQWATLFESVFGNYEEAKVTFTNMSNSMWTVFAEPLSNFNETVSEAMAPPEVNIHQWKDLITDLKSDLGLSSDQFNEFEKVLAQVARDSGIDIDKMIEAHGNFTGTIEEGWLNTDIIQEAYDRIINGTTDASVSLEEFQDIVNRVWSGEFGNGQERRDAIEAMGYDPDKIQKLVELGYGFELTLEDLDEETRNLITTYGTDLAEAFKNGGESVESFKSILDQMSGADLRNGIWDNLFHYDPANDDYGALVSYVYAVRDAFAAVFGTLDSGAIHDALESIYEWTLKLLDEDRIESFSTAVENIFHGIHAGIEIIKGAFSVVKAVYNNTLGPLLSGLWNIIKTILSGIGGLLAKADKGASSLTIFADAVAWLNKKLEPVKNVIEAVTNAIAKFVEGLFDGKGVLESFKEAFEGALDDIFGQNGDTWLKKINFRQFIDKLVELKDSVVETFHNMGTVISEFWSAFQNTELGQYLSGVVDSIKNFFSTAWDSVKNWVNGLFSGGDSDFDLFAGIQNGLMKFNDWLKNLDPAEIAQSISDFFINIKNKITNAYESVKNWVENNEILNSVITFVTEKFQALKDALNLGGSDDGAEKEPFIMRVLNSLKTALEWFRDNLPSIIETITDILKGGAIAGIIALILDIKKSFGGNLAGSVTNFFNSLSTALKGFAFERIASGMMKLAIGLAILTAAIGAVAYYVPVDKVFAVAGAISILAIALGVLAMGIAKIKSATASAELMSANSKLIGSKAGVLEGIKGFFGDLGSSLQTLATGAAKAMKYKAIGVMLLGIAAAMAVLAAAVYVFSTIDTADLIKGLIAVIALIGSLTLAMKLLMAGTSNEFSMGLSKSGFSLNSKSIGNLSSGFGFIGMAVAILIFAQVINQIRQYSFSDILKGVISISAIMLALSTAMRIAGGSFKASTGLGAIFVAASMLLFVKAIDKIRGFSYSDILKGVISIGAIMLELGVAMRIAGNSMGIGNGVSAILVAESINILTGAMQSLAQLSWSQILKGAAAITALMVALGVGGILFAAANRIGDLSGALKGLGTILIGVAASIAAVTYALNSGVDLSQIGSGISALAVGLVQGFVDAITGSADAIIGGFVSLLQTLVSYAPQLVDLLITLFITVLNGLSARMDELAEACATFCQALIDNFGQAFEGVDMSGLKSALETLLKTTVVLTLVGKFGGLMGAVQGILAFAAVIAAVGGIMLGIGALVDTFDFSLAEKIGKAVEVMKLIGEGIGSFFGALVGSFIGTTLESFSNSLPAVAENLSSFLDKLQPFIEGCGAIGDDFSNSISRLTTGVAQMTAGSFFTSITDGIAKWMNGSDYDAMNEYLEDFGAIADGLVGFNDKISGVNWASMDQATAAAGVITALIDAVPETGGRLQEFTGYKNLSEAGINFTILGLGVKNFCESIGNTSFNASTAKSAAGAINALLENYPETGGTLQEWVGYKNLSEAEINFTSLGNGVSAFANAIGNTTFNADTATSAAEVINSLIEHYPETGGTLQEFTGYKNLGEAQVNFRSLGKGIHDFAEAIGDTSYNVETATSAAEVIGALIESYPETGGTLQDVLGYKNLADASINYGALGAGVRSFADAIGDATFNADTARDATEVISALIENYPTEGGALQDVMGYKNLADADVNFGALGTGVRSFADALEGATFNKQVAMDATDVLKYLIENVPTTGGLWQSIAGEKDLGQFGANLSVMGTGIADFVGGTQNVTEGDITAATTASQGMIDIFGLEWPTTDGLFGWIKDGLFGGSVSFEDLSTKLTQIGEMAQSLTSNLSVVTADQISTATEAAQGIIDVFNLSWPPTSGLKGFFKNLFEGGDTDWGSISTMGDTIKSFCDSISGISTDKLGEAKTVSESIIELMNLEGWPTTNGLFGDIKTAFEGGAIDWPSLGSDIVDMGSAIGQFSDSISEISTDKLGEAKSVAEAIVDLMTNVDWPEEPGLFKGVQEWLTGGGVNWETIKSDTENMAGAIRSFCEQTEGITDEYISPAKNAADAIIELMNLEGWPEEPGLFVGIKQWFEGGGVNWDTIASDTEKMAGAIKSFCEQTEGITDEYISPAVNAANAIITLIGLEWPSSEGAVSKFFNSLFGTDNGANWDDLKDELPKMGAAIKGFSDATVGISTSAAINASIVAGSLASMINAFSTDDQNNVSILSDFSNHIGPFADNIVDFTETMATVNGDAISSSVSSIESLIGVLTSMSAVDFDSATSFSDALGTLADTGIDNFTTAFADSETTTVQAATDFVDAVIDALSVADDFKTSGSDDGEGFKTGFDDWSDDSKTAATNLISDMKTNLSKSSDFNTVGSDNGKGYHDGFNSWSGTIASMATIITTTALDSMRHQWSFYSAGSDNGKGFKDGLEAWGSSISGAASSMATNAVNSAGRYDSYYDVGKWSMVGFADGMWDNAWRVYEAANSIGDNAANRIRAKMQVQSPSKVFAEIGMYCMMGLGNGFIDNAEQMVYKPIDEVADDSISLMKEALGGLNFEDLDSSPTIRPVLDLSNIQNGAGMIDELLHTESLMGIDAIEAQRLANTINNLNLDAKVNEVYDDANVISVINDLGSRVDNLNEAINNMKLYLNGKDLVGGIVVDMDNALGSYQKKVKKGVL